MCSTTLCFAGISVYFCDGLDIMFKILIWYIQHLNAFRLVVRPFGTNGVKIWQKENVTEAVTLTVLQLSLTWFSNMKISNHNDGALQVLLSRTFCEGGGDFFHKSSCKNNPQTNIWRASKIQTKAKPMQNFKVAKCIRKGLSMNKAQFEWKTFSASHNFWTCHYVQLLTNTGTGF